MSEKQHPIPSFPIRWYLFFRRFPSHLIDFKFLYSVIFKRSPIFWDNFMRMERQRKMPKIDKVPIERPKEIPDKGAWRGDSDDKIPKLISNEETWKDNQ